MATVGCCRKSRRDFPDASGNRCARKPWTLQRLQNFSTKQKSTTGNTKRPMGSIWWDWYAPYLNARQNGSNSEEAAANADRYMDEVFHVLPR